VAANKKESTQVAVADSQVTSYLASRDEKESPRKVMAKTGNRSATGTADTSSYAAVSEKNNDTKDKADNVNEALAENEFHKAALPKKEESFYRRQPAAEGKNTSKPVFEVVKVKDNLLSGKALKDSAVIDDVKLQSFIKGIVTDQDNNPLANAYLKVNNNKTNFFTDHYGNFKIPVTDTTVNLSVSMAGYTTYNFHVDKSRDDALQRIRLQPDSKALSEVVVVGYGSQKKREVTGSVSTDSSRLLTQDAQPVYGWLLYEQYLEKNKKKPEGVADLSGEVVVSFQVNKKGILSDFKVEHSLAKAFDEEALRLIKEGPPWKLLKGRKSRVTVIVRF
jgi:TonB family protein